MYRQPNKCVTPFEIINIDYAIGGTDMRTSDHLYYANYREIFNELLNNSII